MKTYDVIVERQNGHYRALIPTLPSISVEGTTRDEAVINAKAAAECYLSKVEVTTVELAERSVQPRQNGALEDDQAEERAELIAALEQIEPETELGARLISLRLQMLREGQRLRSMDEINRDLGREEYADLS
jgi:predicted RNase H-like HicB family nuclease